MTTLKLAGVLVIGAAAYGTMLLCSIAFWCSYALVVWGHP